MLDVVVNIDAVGVVGVVADAKGQLVETPAAGPVK